ncbi:MAG: polyketide cyclase [Pseudomonadota bacterium]
MQKQTGEIASGTNRNFSFVLSTTNPDGIWDLWTKPSTWETWDRGLKSANMEDQMMLGSVGQITPKSGPPSSFTVVAFDPKQSYAFETKLPGAVLRVDRFFNANRTQFIHRVGFKGITAFAFARIFGPGFRQALPETMRVLETLADQH